MDASPIPGPALARRALALAGIAQVVSMASILGLLVMAAVILGPTDYRQVGVAVSLIVFAALGAHLSLGQSLLARRRVSDVPTLRRTAHPLLRQALACSILGLGLLAWRGSAIDGPVHELSWSMALFAAALIPVSVWEAHQAGWLIATGSVRRHNQSLILSRLAGLGLGVGLLASGFGPDSVPIALLAAGLANILYGMAPHREELAFAADAPLLRSIIRQAIPLHLAVVGPLVATQAVVLGVYTLVSGPQAVAFHLAVQAMGLAAVLPTAGAVHLGGTLSSLSAKSSRRARADVAWLLVANTAAFGVAAAVAWAGADTLGSYEAIPPLLLGLLCAVPGIGVFTAFLPVWVTNGDVGPLSRLAVTSCVVALVAFGFTVAPLGAWAGVGAIALLYAILLAGGLALLRPQSPQARPTLPPIPAEINTVAVVAHFRAGESAIPTLRALLDQRPPLAGLVVVDDGGGGPEADAVEEWLAQASAAPTWREFLRTKENRGPASAFAAGTALAVERGADFVWLSDQDMVPEPDCLATLVHGLRRHPDCSAAVPARTEPVTGLAYRQYRVHRGHLENATSVGPTTFQGIAVFSGLLLRHPPDALTKFPKDLFIDSDDFLFTLRISRETGPLLFVPAARAAHACGLVSRRRLFGIPVPVVLSPNWRLYYRARNQWYFVREAHPSWLGSVLMYARTFTPVAVAHILFQPARRQVLTSILAGLRDAARGVQGKRHA